MNMNFLSEKHNDFFQDSFQNTWRNIVVGVIVGACMLGVGTYGLYSRLFAPVIISDSASSSIVRVNLDSEIRGVKEYASYVIGGDVSAHPPILIPQERTMFIPFDTRRISASHVVVKDVESGKVLFGMREYEPRSLASITKLMSSLVLEEIISDWKQSATSSRDSIYDSHVYSGVVDTLEEWFRLGLVVSSNRAVLTLVDGSGISREDFVVRMNEKAREMGMVDTVFTDPTGIDAGNRSSAADAAILLVEALKNDHIAKTLSVHSIDYTGSVGGKNKTIWNTNWLLTNWVTHDFFEPVVGKTGYIIESDYNFAGRFVADDTRKLIVVVLGSHGAESRFTDAQVLAEWAFRNYEWR